MLDNKQDKFIVLMYHKIGEGSDFIPALDARVFQKQISFIKKFYNVIPLEDIFILPSSRNRKAKAVVTFDDGYRSIYKYAYPILKKYNIPATVFLTVDSIEKNIPIWPDLVSHYISTTQKDSIDLVLGGSRVSFSFGSTEEKIKAIKEIKDLFKRISNDERLMFMQELKQKLEVNDDVGEGLEMLSWDEIREMSKNNIFFGGHTLSHPILPNLSLEETKMELIQSKRIIEEKLNTSVYSFAYPNGLENDFNNDIKNILVDSGYRLACTTIFGKNDRNTDSLGLKRVYTSGNSLLKFAWRLKKA